MNSVQIDLLIDYVAVSQLGSRQVRSGSPMCSTLEFFQALGALLVKRRYLIELASVRTTLISTRLLDSF